MARYGYNYFAPTRPKVLRRQVAQSVNAQIAPYLQSINRRGAAGSALINQGTESLAASLSGAQGQARQIYSDAEARQAAVDSALSQQLSGAGASQSAALSAQLGQANIPTSNLLANIGSGAANAGAAMGSANIARLIAQGASQQEYAANLPNIARLSGAQQQQRYQGQLETQRQDILGKVPGLISTSTQQAQDREFQKQVAAQSGLAKIGALNESARSHDLSYKARMAAITAANKRSGMTLKERAKYHNRSLEQQAQHDKITADQAAQRLKQQRRAQFIREQELKYKRQHPSGSSGGGSGPPSMKKHQ